MDYHIQEEKILEVLKENVYGLRGSIAFSGGLDSSLLYVISDRNLVPYTVGYSFSHDVNRAKFVLSLLNGSGKYVTLDEINIENYVKYLKSEYPDINKVEISFELVLEILLENVDSDLLVTGQGADELFFGYKRSVNEMDNSLQMERLLKRTIPREKDMAKRQGKELVTPFLDDRILKLASEISPAYHCLYGGKKALREIAKIAGLPEEVYGYRKKAAQYGSGIDKALKSVSYFGLF